MVTGVQTCALPISKIPIPSKYLTIAGLKYSHASIVCHIAFSSKCFTIAGLKHFLENSRITSDKCLTIAGLKQISPSGHC